MEKELAFLESEAPQDFHGLFLAENVDDSSRILFISFIDAGRLIDSKVSSPKSEARK